jgi:hypothetical protein
MRAGSASQSARGTSAAARASCVSAGCTPVPPPHLSQPRPPLQLLSLLSLTGRIGVAPPNIVHHGMQAHPMSAVRFRVLFYAVSVRAHGINIICVVLAQADLAHQHWSRSPLVPLLPEPASALEVRAKPCANEARPHTVTRPTLSTSRMRGKRDHT